MKRRRIAVDKSNQEMDEAKVKDAARELERDLAEEPLLPLDHCSEVDLLKPRRHSGSEPQLHCFECLEAVRRLKSVSFSRIGLFRSVRLRILSQLTAGTQRLVCSEVATNTDFNLEVLKLRHDLGLNIP